MFKYLFTLFLSGAVISSASPVFAQDFQIRDKPLEMTTAGCTDDPDDFVIGFQTYLSNVRTNPADEITIEWTYLVNQSTQPSDWILNGICDNIICRYPGDPALTGTPQFSKPFTNDRDDDMLLEININAATTASDGVGTYYIEVKTPNQVDTAIFILTKNSATGISGISIKDKQVTLYPNPSNLDNLNIFVNKNLKAGQISIMNIAGQKVLSQAANMQQEVSNVNITSLSPGAYLVLIQDENGETITTRKFIRK